MWFKLKILTRECNKWWKSNREKWISPIFTGLLLIDICLLGTHNNQITSGLNLLTCSYICIYLKCIYMFFMYMCTYPLHTLKYFKTFWKFHYPMPIPFRNIYTYILLKANCYSKPLLSKVLPILSYYQSLNSHALLLIH